MYAPNIGKVKNENSQDLKRMNGRERSRHGQIFPLKSFILVNGLTAPWTKCASVPDLCGDPYAPWDPEDSARIFLCIFVQVLTTHVGVRYALFQNHGLPEPHRYESGSRLSCVPARLYCNSQLMSPMMDLGLNSYDLRKMVRSVLFTTSLLYTTSLIMACLVRP